MTWAQRLERLFKIDVSICPRCEGESRVVAFTEHQAVNGKVLKHLQDKGALLPPPDLLPAARASPTSEWFA